VRLLVLGAGGIVGRATVAEAERRGWRVRARARAELDVTDRRELERAFAADRPELVVNAAAFTRVDQCESAPEEAFRVNAEAVGGIAEACAETGARLLHLSTDYVFDGGASTPFREDHPPAPRSVYGASKLEGERRALAAPGALVVRTSWVFGRGGSNFVDAITDELRRGEGPLRVVADQVGGPTYAPFLARALADLGESSVRGIVHYRNREPVSWHELALAVARRLGSRVEIQAVGSEEFPRPARAPGVFGAGGRALRSGVGRAVEPGKMVSRGISPNLRLRREA
jgi:dTDP-4-dehydrorhamnose reductase